jgi:Ala-tRNA(Pro) deacylase
MSVKTSEELMALLDALGVAYVATTHRPFFTVEDGRDFKASMPGGHSKNLFLKDKKGALYLVSALDESVIDLNALSKVLGAARFSFGSGALMQEKLGVTPGAVTAFALINDPAHYVRFVLDNGFFAHETIYFHPLRNDATIGVSPAGLMRFLEALGVAPLRVAFAPGAAPRLIDPAA